MTKGYSETPYYEPGGWVVGGRRLLNNIRESSLMSPLAFPSIAEIL